MRKKMALGTVLVLLAAGLWFWSAGGAGSKRQITIGVLQFTANNLTTLDGFKAGMEELGYREGENVRYVFDGPAATRSELDMKMAELLGAQPDLVFTSPTPATLIAQQATRTSRIPVVFAPVNDPVAAGIVSDIRNPGENVTGIRLAASDGKRLQWLKEISPSLSKVFLPYNAAGKSALTSYGNAKAAAEALGVELIGRPVRSVEEIRAAMEEIDEDVDAIFLPRDGMVMSRIKEFVALTTERRIMLSTPRLKQVQQGALTGYGFIGFELGKQAARLADKILKGADPGTLPIETAEDYLFVNLGTADAIGIPIEDHILRQARDVIRPD